MENKKIEVLGSGCPTCKKFHSLAVEAAGELGLAVEIDYVDDIQRILQLGLMQSPVLVIEGKAILVGFTSDVDRIKKAIKDNL